MRIDKITAISSKTTLNYGFGKKITTALTPIETIKSEIDQHIDTASHQPAQ
jgi:hypothetical protein